jgi:hypothetical protein
MTQTLLTLILTTYALHSTAHASTVSCVTEKILGHFAPPKSRINRTYTNHSTGRVVTDAESQVMIIGDRATAFISANSENQIGYLGGYLHDSSLDITLARVKDDFQNQGVQDDLFKLLIEKLPQVQRIETDLTGTNSASIAKSIIEYAKKQPDFNSLNEGHKISAQLERVIEKQIQWSQDPNDPIAELNRCCRRFIDLIQGNSKRFKEMLLYAVERTPAYRSRKKNGFGRMCEEPTPVFNYDDGLLNPLVKLVVCRD